MSAAIKCAYFLTFKGLCTWVNLRVGQGGCYKIWIMFLEMWIVFPRFASVHSVFLQLKLPDRQADRSGCAICAEIVETMCARYALVVGIVSSRMNWKTKHWNFFISFH